MKIVEIGVYTFNIGTNAQENDKLISNSNVNDTWFHLEHLPSCHGVINCPLKGLSKQDIFKCALYIKINTKYKKTSGLHVIYTEIQNIEKTDTLGQVFILKKCKRVRV